MLQVTDLRYGNWLKAHLTGEYIQVDWLVMKHMHDGNMQSAYTPDIPVYEPIPLTHAMLSKAGFVAKNNWFYKKGFLLGYLTTDDHLQAEWKFGGAEGGWNLLNIEYVHQLQNLYYDFYRKELEIKL